MRVISRKKLRLYWELHLEAQEPLEEWMKLVRAAKWGNAVDLRAAIPSARPLGNRRVRFPILGNRYRLIVAIRFDTQIVYIRFIGTHAEYDRIPDASQV